MNKPNLIFLHGFLGNRHFWDPIETQIKMALPNSTTQRINLPGHGNSSFFLQHPTDTPAFTDVTEWIASFSSNPSPSWLVGYSMGARLALGTLLNHGELFHGAILFSVHPGITNKDQRRQRLVWEKELLRLLNTTGENSAATNADAAKADAANAMIPLVDHFESLPIFEPQKRLSKSLLASQRKTRLSHDPRQIAKAVSVLGLGNTPPMVEALGKNSKPILIVTGSLDKKYACLASQISETCPFITHTNVDDVGHNVVLESPESSAQCIVDFITENGA